MSALNPYYIIDDDDEGVQCSDSDIELLDYDSDSPEPSTNSIESDNHPPSSSQSIKFSSKKRRELETPQAQSVSARDAELQTYRLSNGTVIQPGDTVELVDHTKQDPDAMHSGSFLRVKHIIKDLTTDEIRLRGYMLVRTKYIGQVFDWKLNELAMTLHVREDDHRSPFISGMEDVLIDEILRKRDCVFSNKPFPLQSFRGDPRFARFPASMTKQGAARQIFHEARLCCRVIYMRFSSPTGKDTSGIVRHLHADETDNSSSVSGATALGLSRENSFVIEDDDEDEAVIVSRGSHTKRRERSPSVEILDSPAKRRISYPTKKEGYTFADVFCGAGGATQGAVQAGLHVCWGLDVDEEALNAYTMNHPGALPFRRNAHEFPPKGFKEADLRVDVLHLSPPCCYWSPAHTSAGQNDQANYEAIYTVGPILKAVKPRVATLEQTFGLMTHEEHQKNFKMLLNDIGKAGYDLRYKLQDMSKLGLVQKRKRLLIIAARRGTPLPPFPEDTHGEPGSGLKPFVFIDDALKVMSRLGPRAFNDEYHQPKPMATPKPPYNAHSFLKGCITTSGGDNYHFNGMRRYTVREMALFQSFPYTYQLSGGRTQAMKQVGNAFPPVIAEAMYRSIIMTLNAFDEGIISAEDDLTDLEGVFAALRLNSWRSSPAPPSFFDGATDDRDAQNRETESEADEDDDEVVFLGSTDRR